MTQWWKKERKGTRISCLFTFPTFTDYFTSCGRQPWLHDGSVPVVTIPTIVTDDDVLNILTCLRLLCKFCSSFIVACVVWQPLIPNLEDFFICYVKFPHCVDSYIVVVICACICLHFTWPSLCAYQFLAFVVEHYIHDDTLPFPLTCVTIFASGSVEEMGLFDAILLYIPCGVHYVYQFQPPVPAYSCVAHVFYISWIPVYKYNFIQSFVHLTTYVAYNELRILMVSSYEESYSVRLCVSYPRPLLLLCSNGRRRTFSWEGDMAKTGMAYILLYLPACHVCVCCSSEEWEAHVISAHTKQTPYSPTACCVNNSHIWEFQPSQYVITFSHSPKTSPTIHYTYLEIYEKYHSLPVWHVMLDSVCMYVWEDRRKEDCHVQGGEEGRAFCPLWHCSIYVIPTVWRYSNKCCMDMIYLQNKAKPILFLCNITFSLIPIENLTDCNSMYSVLFLVLCVYYSLLLPLYIYILDCSDNIILQKQRRGHCLVTELLTLCWVFYTHLPDPHEGRRIDVPLMK